MIISLCNYILLNNNYTHLLFVRILEIFRFLRYPTNMIEHLINEPKEKVWENVYRHIRTDLQNHRYKPNEILSEVDIAKELGVSRTPVSMAFNVLEQEGLITNNGGKKVLYRLSADELIELFDAKISLQCTIVKLAIARKTAEEEDELKSLLKEIEVYLDSDFSHLGVNPELYNLWVNLDNRYHIILAKMSKSSYIHKLIEDCDLKWTRIRSGVNAIGDRTKKNAEEHIILGNMLLNNETQQAVSYMKHHLENILQTVLHLMNIF